MIKSQPEHYDTLQYNWKVELNKKILVESLKMEQKGSGTNGSGRAFPLPVHYGSVVVAILCSFFGDISTLHKDIVVGNGAYQF